MTRDMLRIMAQENLMCSSRPTNRDHLLQLREKFEVFRDSYNTPEDQLGLYFNPCHQEEFQSRTKTQCF